MIDWQALEMSVYCYDCKGEILRLLRKKKLYSKDACFLEELADQLYAELMRFDI